MARLLTNSARAGVVAVGFGLLTAASAQASAVDDANRRLVDIEERTRALTNEFREKNAPDPNAADRRLVEAQTYFQLKNYDVAATLCLDIIERFPKSMVYDEALVLLGDSLYKADDLLSARHYFLEAAKRRNGSRFEQDALQRLIEIAMRTRDFDGIEAHLERLRQIPPAQLQPTVPYVRAKYLYTREMYDEALALFLEIPPENPYYLQARYFAATIRVRKRDVAGASQGFEEILRFQPRGPSDKDVQDLARLAIARIFYDRGQFDRARDVYNAVPISSKFSADARFESAWNSIKSNDFKAAFRALDLMMLQNPDSPQAPELRLLMGNLNLRMSNFFVASETFTKSRDEFEPMHRQLDTVRVKAQNDPAYFESLLGKGMERFDISLFVPPGAVKWVKSEPEVARMLVLADDVGDLQRDIRDSERVLAALERAINGTGRVGVFGDLAAARLRSTELLNQTIDVRRRFIGEARSLAVPTLSAEDRAAFDALESERTRLDKELKDLPLTESDLNKREARMRSQFQELDSQASEFNVVIQSLEAQLVAIEQYFIRSKSEQKIRPEDLKQPVEDLKVEVQSLRASLEKVRTDIADAVRDSGLAGAALVQERDDASRLGDVMRKENEILARARYAMKGGDQAKFDAIASILNKSDGLQGRLAEFDRRLETIAEKRLVDVRQRLADEKAHLNEASARLGGVLTESQSVGGGLAQAMIGKISGRFYDLTVQSDVGLIDVSWGLKDQKTSTLSKLINQQKLELKSVEEDFKPLLEEEK